jgi:beta-lactamase superfamily II metal-dependent hydrolase
MRRRRRVAALTITALLVGLLVVVAFSGTSSQAGHPNLTYHAYLPQVAADSAVGTTGFEVIFIDVGQGDATLITVGGQRLLIDGGRSKTTIKTRLQALGITDLDAIVATHPDADHIGGLTEVLAMYTVERIYLNGGTSTSQTFAEFMLAVNAEGAQVTTLSRGQTIPLGGLQISVLHPAAV